MNRLVAVIFFLVSFHIAAQDRLIHVSNLHFASATEEEAFLKLLSEGDNKQAFNVLITCGSAADSSFIDQAWNSFEAQLPKLQAIYNKEKRNDKRIKAVYDHIHKTFLHKYEERNRFQEIFSTGNYNCVSATALYALYFDRLGIPYQIKELPTHVYLLAYPETDQIKVESTSPLYGVFTVNDDFKEGFVKMLRDNKLVSQNEYTTETAETLFNKYYFKDNSITLQQLAAIQYMNSALYLHDDGKLFESYHQIQKAYELFKTERTLYLMSTIGLSAFSSHKVRDQKQAELLASLAQLVPLAIEEDMIVGEFNNVIQELLYASNKRDQLDAYYQILIKRVSNAKLRNDLDFLYQYEFGRYYYNLGRNKEAKPYWEKALSLEPDNTEMTTAFTSLIARLFVAGGDYVALISEAEQFAAMYPQLRENNNYNTLLVSAYGVQFGLFFNMNKPNEGDKYRQMFELLLAKYPDVEVASSIVGQSYSLAAVYYYRKGQTTKARALIEKGLALSPNNPELQVRKEMINR